MNIKNLSIKITGDKDKTILFGINLNFKSGNIHAIIGPNGSGKSTIAQVIAGNPNYEIVSGEIIYDNKNILELSPDERAKLGIFLAFQYPIAIEGVSYFEFLKASYTAITGDKINVFHFRKLLREKMALLEIPENFMDRDVNMGLSGGEKKKMEVLQILLLNPKFVILDELDSGLDIDSLKIIFQSLRNYKDQNPELTILLITHYNKIYDYLMPDNVTVLESGKIKETGGFDIIQKIEKKGYK